MATSPYFASLRRRPQNGDASKNTSSVLPKLTSQGNLIAGATTRVGVGFLLNPFSVLKARFEVGVIILVRVTILTLAQSNIYAYESLTGAFGTIVRQGPSELLRGFLASSLRDAPYAGLFVVFYEGIKHEACKFFSLHFFFSPLSSVSITIAARKIVFVHCYLSPSLRATTRDQYSGYVDSRILCGISWCYRHNGDPSF
jgi:hypothetical protein